MSIHSTLKVCNGYCMSNSVCSSQDELGVQKNVQYTQKSPFIWVDIVGIWTPKHPLGQNSDERIHDLSTSKALTRFSCYPASITNYKQNLIP